MTPPQIINHLKHPPNMNQKLRLLPFAALLSVLGICNQSVIIERLYKDVKQDLTEKISSSAWRREMQTPMDGNLDVAMSVSKERVPSR